jgi:hypothetical protein
MRLLCLFLLFTLSAVAQPEYSVVRSEPAGQWESQAADDLAAFVGQMTGSQVPVLTGPPASGGVPLYVGAAALRQRPSLGKALERVKKKDPVFRADAIAVEVDNDAVYLAGSNDDSHYFAVAWFLQRQGCRWYLPTKFGEHVPQLPQLKLDPVVYAYAPPFEVRTYWISWNGDRTDYETFGHRNFYNLERSVHAGHNLGSLLPKAVPGQDLQINSPSTVQTVADNLDAAHQAGKPLSLSIDDGVQVLSKADRQLAAALKDKAFYSPAMADVFLPFYNAVCEELWRRHPDSASKVGFLAYANLTLPPQRAIVAAQPLIAFVAPIDVDPNHALDDARSPGRLDLRGALERWVRVMQGRVIIYDYDQSMLVWRDLPNPSHHVMQRDVRIYRDLGILGFATESRNAIATTFTNLFFRGQLYWDPEFDVDGELQAFYDNFYGASGPAMRSYWDTIYQAWQDTRSMDHEFYLIPEVYTPALIEKLRGHLGQVSGDDERLRFTALSFAVLEAYVSMTHAGATLGDFQTAAEWGRKGLAAREQLTEMNGTFTTYLKMPEKGAAWWPGEVQMYADLAALTDGWKEILPLEWQFQLDPLDNGLWRNWGSGQQAASWSSVRTDLQPRAQLAPDTIMPGYAWYACRVRLPKKAPLKDLRLLFPGIFNTSWLYVNGSLVDFREQKLPWWANDYTFAWDASTGQALREGENVLVVRTEILQHPSGIFRRPLLYQKK